MPNENHNLSLGVNIDHIALLREGRRVNDPNLLHALPICERAGAEQITIHLREDRRHIQDSDVEHVVAFSNLPVNVECSINRDIIAKIITYQPIRATLVPENRDEVTTEGGLDVLSKRDAIAEAVHALQRAKIECSLFIDPNKEQIDAAHALGVEYVELHTGEYANLFAMLYGSLRHSHHSIQALELPVNTLKERLNQAVLTVENSAKYAHSLGLKVAAGHGLNYQNVATIAQITEIKELNIGQSIIARSVYSGLHDAITSMLSAMKRP